MENGRKNEKAYVPREENEARDRSRLFSFEIVLLIIIKK